MSLNWDITECPGGHPDNDDESMELQTLIFSTIAVGLHGIDVEGDNIPEYYTRLLYLDAIYGDSVYEEALPIEALYRWRGLRCNVADETRNEFLKRQQRYVMDRFERKTNAALADFENGVDV